ncbi:hypothetical protein E2E30_09415 [Sphingomonas sp. AAP5]|uniref:DUF6771 family protein n=1 Tax=Sphingomonas sp. AAP5 TaxID=1523415 RepID=UPI0010573C7D|nr:DUF6771 family protein [Sphingomonas sp. AAP5]QBM75962.1 hypothetical protein E2E30_09415 [Sphingomonas sp. AAP5]
MSRLAPQPAPADLSSAILSAPGWARVGITMPDARMRERAADALAQSILEQVFEQDRTAHADQLRLPL